MNLSTILATLNGTTILLLAGVALLLINIIYGAIQDSRGHVRAGWFTVLISLGACLMITIGAVQAASVISGPAFAAGAGFGAGGALSPAYFSAGLDAVAASSWGVDGCFEAGDSGADFRYCDLAGVGACADSRGYWCC